MKTQLVHKEPFTIAGLYCRTDNATERSDKPQIMGLWMRFFEEGLPGKLPAAGPEFYGVYFNYESDADGKYDYIVGMRVPKGAELPDGVQTVEIPAGDYLQCTSDRGPMPGIVMTMWSDIWETKGEFPEGSRAYGTDFEIYDDRAADQTNAEMDLFLSIIPKQ